MLINTIPLDHKVYITNFIRNALIGVDLLGNRKISLARSASHLWQPLTEPIYTQVYAAISTVNLTLSVTQTPSSSLGDTYANQY